MITRNSIVGFFGFALNYFISTASAISHDSSGYCANLLRNLDPKTHALLLRAATNELALHETISRSAAVEVKIPDRFVHGIHALKLIGTRNEAIRSITTPILEQFLFSRGLLLELSPFTQWHVDGRKPERNAQAESFEARYFSGDFGRILEDLVRSLNASDVAIDSSAIMLFETSKQIEDERLVGHLFSLAAISYLPLSQVPLREHEISSEDRILFSLIRVFRFISDDVAIQGAWRNANDANAAIASLALVDRASPDWPFARQLLFDFSERLAQEGDSSDQIRPDERTRYYVLALKALAATGDIDRLFARDSSEIAFASHSNDSETKGRAIRILERHPDTVRIARIHNELAVLHFLASSGIITQRPDDIESLTRRISHSPLGDGHFANSPFDIGTSAFVRRQIDQLRIRMTARVPAEWHRQRNLDRARRAEPNDPEMAYNLFLNAGEIDEAQRVAAKLIEAKSRGAFVKYWWTMILKDPNGSMGVGHTSAEGDRR